MKAWDSCEAAEGAGEISTEIPSGVMDVTNDEGDNVLTIVALDDGGFQLLFHQWRNVSVDFDKPNIITCRKAD